MAAKLAVRVREIARDVSGSPGITITVNYELIEAAEAGSLDSHLLFPLNQDDVRTRLVNDVLDQLAQTHSNNRFQPSEVLLFGF